MHRKKTEISDYDYALVTYVGDSTEGDVDSTVRRFLHKEPPPSKFGADLTGDGANGDLLETTVGYVGGVVVYPTIKGAMYLVKTALSMFQALALMCIYIAIPFAVPFAVPVLRLVDEQRNVVSHAKVLRPLRGARYGRLS